MNLMNTENATCDMSRFHHEKYMQCNALPKRIYSEVRQINGVPTNWIFIANIYV